MKLKKLLCTVLAAAMLMTGTAVMADETAESTIKLEGEYFNLRLGGVATTPTNDNLYHREDSSNDYTLYYLGTEQPEYEAEFYAEESGMYTMQYLTNLYAKTAEETWRTQYKFTLNGTDYDGSLAAKLSTTPAQGGEYAIYEISVYLNKGLNTLKFTGTTTWTAGDHNGKYQLELDYVQFTKVTVGEIEIAGSGIYYTNKDKVYAEGDEIKTFTFNAPLDGVYKIDWKTQPHDFNGLWMSTWALAVNGESVTDFTRTSGSNASNRAEYSLTVPLSKGENTMTFTLGECTHNDRAHTYDLYYDYIKMTKVGDIQGKSAKVVIEGEKPTTKTNTSMDAVTAENASGGAVGIGATKNSPASVTYNATVDYDGDYNLEFVLWDYEQVWMAPVAVTVKQGDDVIIDDKVISTTGTYTLQEYDEDMKEWATQEATSCEVTATKGTLSATYGGYAFKNFIWKDKAALKAGNVEVTMSYAGMPSGQTGENKVMYMGIDAVTFARDIDYADVQIKADAEEILDGSTLQLAVEDIYGSAIEANDEVDDVTTISWTSSNNNILSVDENGLLTTVNPGIATVTATVEHNGTAATAEKTFTVMTANEQFVIKSCTLDGNDVVVKYMAKGDVSNNKITLIAGRFPTSAANTSLAEVKTAEITGNAPSMYRTARITLDDTTGKIKLFSWKDLDTIAPVFSAIEVN